MWHVPIMYLYRRTGVCVRCRGSKAGLASGRVDELRKGLTGHQTLHPVEKSCGDETEVQYALQGSDQHPAQRSVLFEELKRKAAKTHADLADA